MAPAHPTYLKVASSTPTTSQLRKLSREVMYDKYLREFRVEQCPLFLQHKCQQHRPFNCFNWHFQNQRRRRPIKQEDGFFNYSSDIYCTKYDETTGICPDGEGCPLLHRTSGDTERRYHLKYYKTSLCVHSSDSRGFCIKNGPHCAFGHGNNDLRLPVRDIKDKSCGDNDTEIQLVSGFSQGDKEQRTNIPDDPKWRETQYVVLHYKTEFCKKTPRLCRQGYACPFYHNGKDKRRSHQKIRYRSTPCPNVKNGDEWGDPAVCESGDDCMYCHTRTEQQFHPEIYKSTKCNDMASQSYCPRGVYCAFAHSDNETITWGASSSDSNDRNYSDDYSVRSVSSDDEGIDFSEPQVAKASGNGSCVRSKTPTFEENGVDLPIAKHTNLVSTGLVASSFESGLSAINTFSNRNRFLSGDNRESLIRRQLFAIDTDQHLMEGDMNLGRSSMIMDMPTNQGDYDLGSSLDPIEPSENLTNDPFGGNKSRKSSGFSETTTNNRHFSGYEQNKSRNCSGNSGSPGYLSGSTPMMIPNSGHLSPQGHSPSMNRFMNGCLKAPLSPGSDSSISIYMKDVEITQLKEELEQSMAKLSTYEESMSQARAACEAWKNECVCISRKLDEALRDKEMALAKLNQLQNEMDALTMEAVYRSRLISN